jgi:hypothetical protein
MSMSDCMHCWSTPCCCGKDGYLVAYPSPENIEIYKTLSNDELDLLHDILRNELNRILTGMRTTTK